ncbi:MAG: PEP-CTERM sorting domain-containing protein [Acetobacteraceae bacterium]
MPAAHAAVVYSEDFNSLSFAGASVLPNDTSDSWASTAYYQANSVNGWTMNNGALYAQKIGSSPNDGALLLNETPVSGVASTITGLTQGQLYSLDFLQWGDNKPGQAYVGKVTIDGNLFTYSGVDGAPGTNPGTMHSYLFVASGTSAVLQFGESSGTAASPIVDNVTISEVPEPATLGILGLAMAGLGALRRGRRSPSL